MIILGIHDGHNSTAAILKNGKVIVCVSEERFSRVKNEVGHPTKAIEFVLSESNTTPEQIDVVALCTKETDPVAMKMRREAIYGISDYIREMHEYWKPLISHNKTTDFWERMLKTSKFKDNASPYNIDFIKNTPKEKWGATFNRERIRRIVEQLEIPENKIRFIDHHTGHAYYAYFASFRKTSHKAVIVTADGWGDGCNATISVAEKDTVKEIRRTAMCNLARMYRWATLLLGMRPNEHEYKVMGLAPYAKDYIYKPAYEIYKETLVVDGLDFKWNKKPSDMYFYFKEKFEGIRFDGIAAGLQLWLEELLSEWITNIMIHTQGDSLYFSGGLSLNVKANKVIANLPDVKNFYVPPGGGDESLAIGAAFALSQELGEESFPLENAYLGYISSEKEFMEAVEPFRNNPNFKVIDNPDSDKIAELFIEGKVLGRCSNKMEFGARSLGNRSILCDPSKYQNLRLINEKIKFRDFWMPFTPSILYERADDYIVNPKKLQAEYMTVAFDSTPLAKEHLKAALHPYDFTVRPQLVTPENNAEYYSIIKAFERKTGIGALLNTSLNLHGYPIVCTATDAIETLTKSGLDGMIFPGALILKQRVNVKMETIKMDLHQRYVDSMKKWEEIAYEISATEYGKISAITSSFIIILLLSDKMTQNSNVSPYIVGHDIFQAQIVQLTNIKQAIDIMELSKEDVSPVFDINNTDEIENFNMSLFDQLWAPYDEFALREAMERVKKRLALNGFGPAFFKNKKCVDLGCGGGRFSFVLSEMGAAHVTGIDLGTKSIKSAKETAAGLNLEDMSFKFSTLYDTGLSNDEFDFAVSNGVVHHHTNINDAFKEIYRILKPGAFLWLYLVSEENGIYTLSLECLKRVMRMIPVKLTLNTLKSFKIPPNKYMTVLDSMYAVYFYNSREHIYNTLKSIGFSKIKELRLSDQYDQVVNSQESKDRLGGGEIRIIAIK